MTPASPASRPQTNRPRSAFTLLELLLVIGIVSLLVAILIPAMSGARNRSRVAVCTSNLREVGLAIQSYAQQWEGAIPRGPNTPIPFAPNAGWDEWASNQIWLMGLNAANGLGPLVAQDMAQPKALYCPGDDTNDPTEELAKFERHADEDVYCSYLYRQRDQVSRDRLDDLGRNGVGLPARALALDVNSLAPGDLGRTNHDAKQVNVLYLDGHARTVGNDRHIFSLRAQDYFGFPNSVERRLNQILINADVAEDGDVRSAPQLP